MQMKQLIKDRRGVAAMEFTIIAGVLITLLVAAFDFANVATQQIALQSALKAGGAYLQYFPTAGISNVTAKIQQALPDGAPTVTVQSIQCYCAGATTASSCPDSTGSPACAAPWLMRITASMPDSTFWLPLWSGTISNQAKYEIRIQ